MAKRRTSGTGVLSGQRIAFAGRWATLSRPAAEALIATHGGLLTSRVTPETTLVVVGAGGWPLRKDGRVSRNLRHAELCQRKGQPVEILQEQQLLERLGMTGQASAIGRRLTAAELAKHLKLPGTKIRSWVQAGLLIPAETQQGVAYFDFQQAAGVRALSRLLESGVRPERLERTMRRLRQWLPNVAEPLARLESREFGGRLLARDNEGHLVDVAGQRYFEFDDEPEPAILSWQPAPRSAEEWFHRGVELEQAGDLQNAADAYREAALAGGPTPELCFNLANVLLALGRKPEAAERLRQTVELKPSFAEAWNNLGVVLSELKDPEGALAAFAHALEADPAYGDAHYNRADLLEQLGRMAEAQVHWQAYLRTDQQSAWAKYAAQRLAR